jgi:hypothetical protein
MAHRRAAYLKKGDKHVAKYMPLHDGPYKIIAKHAECSTFTLDLPNQPEIFNVFHASELEPYIKNNTDLFPSRTLTEPAPIITVKGKEEWKVEEIIDERARGRGKQYLVRYAGYGPDHERSLSGCECADLKALDCWLARDAN